MRGIVDLVVDARKVLEVVVELLRRPGFEKTTGHGIGLACLMMPFPRSGCLHVMHVGKVLTVGGKGSVVFDRRIVRRGSPARCRTVVPARARRNDNRLVVRYRDQERSV